MYHTLKIDYAYIDNKTSSLLVVDMYKCPKCGQDNNELIKEWAYGPYGKPTAKVRVERYKCKKCGIIYRAWIGKKSVKVVKE